MIVAECSVFLTMLAGGMVAAFFATLFLALGGASKAARCVFDLLTPIAVGGVFLLFLYISSSGVFRVYALVAFLLGGALFRWLYRLVRPSLKKLLCRLIVPIKSLEDRVERRLLPLREKRERRRAERRLLREEKRRHHAEEKAKRRLEKQEKRRIKEEKKERKRRLAAREKREKEKRRLGERFLSRRSTIKQSH